MLLLPALVHDVLTLAGDTERMGGGEPELRRMFELVSVPVRGVHGLIVRHLCSFRSGVCRREGNKRQGTSAPSSVRVPRQFGRNGGTIMDHESELGRNAHGFHPAAGSSTGCSCSLPSPLTGAVWWGGCGVLVLQYTRFAKLGTAGAY